jgi:hypothetical protein
VAFALLIRDVMPTAFEIFLDTTNAIALMMEAARSSETLVNFYQTTRRYNPEDSHLRLLNVHEIEKRFKQVYRI